MGKTIQPGRKRATLFSFKKNLAQIENGELFIAYVSGE